MPVEELTATPQATGNDAINAPWQDKLEREWMQTRLAHEGMMMAKIKAQTEEVLNSVRAAKGGDAVAQASPASSLGVKIGDEVTNHITHYHVPPSDRWPPTDPRGTRPTPSAIQTESQSVAPLPDPPRVEQPRAPIVPYPQPIAPEPAAVKEPESKSRIPSWLLPVIAAAGVGAGGAAAYDYFTGQPAPYTDTDTDKAIKTGVDITTGEPTWGKP